MESVIPISGNVFGEGDDAASQLQVLVDGVWQPVWTQSQAFKLVTRAQAAQAGHGWAKLKVSCPYAPRNKMMICGWSSR